jgi:hypothetical protein
MSRFVVVEYEATPTSGGSNRKKVEIAPSGEYVRYGEGMVFVEGLRERVIVPLSRLLVMTVEKEAVAGGNNHG